VALTSRAMQRLCQTTRRCGIAQQARMRGVTAVAAWVWTDGDEALVSMYRQVSACRLGWPCPGSLSLACGPRARVREEKTSPTVRLGVHTAGVHPARQANVCLKTGSRRPYSPGPPPDTAALATRCEKS